jgi:hypothetical protein
MIEKIYYKNILIGIRIAGHFPKGSIPHTDEKEALGLLTLTYPAGSHLKAHVHKPKKRITHRLQECFIVHKGKARIDLYGPDKKLFKRIYITTGQLFIALNGGHGFHILQDAEIIELKNGPFIDDKHFI